jgi:hypothetical protein
MHSEPSPRSFLLRVRWHQGRWVAELQDLRSGNVQRFAGLRGLWRYLRTQGPGLR